MKHNTNQNLPDDSTDLPAPVVENVLESTVETDPESKAVGSHTAAESLTKEEVATAHDSNSDIPDDSRVQHLAPKNESQLGGWSWLIRFGVKSAGVVTVGALLLFLIGVAQRIEWVTASGFSGSSVEAAGGGEDKRYICPMLCTCLLYTSPSPRDS